MLFKRTRRHSVAAVVTAQSRGTSLLPVAAGGEEGLGVKVEDRDAAKEGEAEEPGWTAASGQQHLRVGNAASPVHASAETSDREDGGLLSLSTLFYLQPKVSLFP